MSDNDDIIIGLQAQATDRIGAARAALAAKEPVPVTIVMGLAHAAIAPMYEAMDPELFCLLNELRAIKGMVGHVREVEKQLRGFIRAARRGARNAQGPQRQPEDDGRPQVILSDRLDCSVSETIEAVSQLPDIFQCNRQLHRVITEVGEHDYPFAMPLDADSMATQMSRAAEFLGFDGRSQEYVRKAPPAALARAVLAHGEYPHIRQLTGVTTIPRIRPDGQIVSEWGYDSVSGMFYAGPPVEIPQYPRKFDAEEARDDLLDAFSEFPFSADCDKSALLALILSLCGRDLFQDVAPLFVVQANQPRVGKSKVAQAAGMIALGRKPNTGAPPHSREEFDKQVVSYALSHPDMVLFDNLAIPVGCATLDMAITTTDFEARVLGKSKNARVENLRTIWCITQNSVAFAGDTAKRTIPIRLECNEAQPEARRFRKPDFFGHVRARQVALRRAALVILRAYICADMPTVDLPRFGSFESWEIIRQICCFIDLPDPWLTRVSGNETTASNDTDENNHDRLVALLEALFADREFTSRELAERVDADGSRNPHRILAGDWDIGEAQDLFAELEAWDRSSKCTDRLKLALALRSVRGRPSTDGARISAAGKHPKTKQRLWRVERA